MSDDERYLRDKARRRGEQAESAAASGEAMLTRDATYDSMRLGECADTLSTLTRERDEARAATQLMKRVVDQLEADLKEAREDSARLVDRMAAAESLCAIYFQIALDAGLTDHDIRNQVAAAIDAARADEGEGR